MEKKGVTPRGLLLSLAAFVILLQLASGAGLFFLHLGFSPESVALFYRGDAEHFSAPKSVPGLLKTTLPHLIAMTVIALFLLHLLPCTKRCKGLLSACVFSGMILDLAGGYLVLIDPLFAAFKLFGFVLLQGGLWIAAVRLITAATGVRS